ncbi:unnamed protein product [Effrenium voratum]|nr:unnamed protein product [Effrenium voratum]
MVTAICHEEQHPSFGTAHRIRYIYGQCGREWIWLEGAAKTLTFRHSKNRIPFQLHKLGLWCPTQRHPAKLSSSEAKHLASLLLDSDRLLYCKHWGQSGVPISLS